MAVVEGTNPGDKGAVFLIDEGRLQRVWSTKFVGNTISSSARLRTQIKTGPPIMYLFGGKVDRKKIDEDVEKLTAYYRALGFFQCKIGRELEFNEKDNWLTLTFIINEGPRYKIRNIEFVGNQKIVQSIWTEKMKLHNNEFFDQAKMNRDLGAIRDAYGCRGYVFADIQADPRFLEEPGQLDLVYEIKEGNRYRVGKIDISITGDDTHTSSRVVYDRLSLRPGDILDTTKLRGDEVRLKRSSVFANDPSKAPKIVFEPPPGMEDAAGGIATKPFQRSSSSSTATPFSNTSGSTPSANTNTNGSGSAYGSNIRGQVPDGPEEPDVYIDIGVSGTLAQSADPRNAARLAKDMSAAVPPAMVPVHQHPEDIDEFDEHSAPLSPRWEPRNNRHTAANRRTRMVRIQASSSAAKLLRLADMKSGAPGRMLEFRTVTIRDHRTTAGCKRRFQLDSCLNSPNRRRQASRIRTAEPSGPNISRNLANIRRDRQ